MPAVRAPLDPTEGLAHTDTGKGRPVVLLHGLTCHLGYWWRVISLLNGVRIVALDFRGHGLSEHRDSHGYVHYERDLLSLLDALDHRITVAGHSHCG
jgi:pimeloyl-ACP methyl ester carboxylesterase